MPRYYFRGRVPMPVNVGGGQVISVQPKTEFEAPASAVAKLIKQKLVHRLPDKKKVEEEKPKAAPAPAPAPKAAAPRAAAPKAEEKKPESEEKKSAEEEKEDDSSGKPNRGFGKKGK